MYFSWLLGYSNITISESTFIWDLPGTTWNVLATQEMEQEKDTTIFQLGTSKLVMFMASVVHGA